MYTPAFPELIRLYADIEEDVRRMGFDCSGCGGCCRFDEADHVLYASALEREYLLASSTVPDCPDGDAALLRAGLRCPFQTGGRCGAREGRVLGCRLHFCRRPETNSESWHSRLKQIHERFGIEWRYAPLLPLEQSGL